ncbi:MAG: kinase [Gammaproteobacteria bacterium]|nr:kinase [Gammaproteobacteria bacterium]
MNAPDRQQALKKMLARHGLPDAYLETAHHWFDPLAKQLAGQYRKQAGRPLLIGINGSQGSGKSTLSEYLRLTLQWDWNLRAVVLSLDDVYHTKSRRALLARQIHPLLATRGVPGTHDMELAEATLQKLLQPGAAAEVRIPRFDKATDDRKPESEWDTLITPVDVVILEGWCLGIPPQQEADLLQPVNELEAREDPQGIWRRYVNQAIECDYLPLYRQVQQWLMLRAPSFDCVFNWRMEQENKLVPTANSQGVMDAGQVARFIQHFQRLTEHGLQVLPPLVHHLFQLDSRREITAYSQPLAGVTQSR